MPLSQFSDRTRAWVEGAFEAPTPAQEQAWPAIASGEHVLLSAPTGSGKTLAAVLWAIDPLSGPRAARAGRPVPGTASLDAPNATFPARAGGSVPGTASSDAPNASFSARAGG